MVVFFLRFLLAVHVPNLDDPVGSRADEDVGLVRVPLEAVDGGVVSLSNGCEVC